MNKKVHQNIVEACKKTYNITSWGKQYFDINPEGNVIAQPFSNAPQHIVLKDVVFHLEKQKKIHPPYLFTFMDIITEGINRINHTFRTVMKENNYPGTYHYIYPIKVNQEENLVTHIIKKGLIYQGGIEVGSKTEFLSIVPFLHLYDFPIICNGYKDLDWMELIFATARQGKTIYIVIEKLAELFQLLKIMKKNDDAVLLGLRIKPFTKSVGRWKRSSGDRSKFGLCAAEQVLALDILKKEGLLHKLKLLHVHIGSQIHKINTLEKALKEISYVFVGLSQMGAPLDTLDLGGGLAVDYIGSTGFFECSRNYNLEQYATVVVKTINHICSKNRIATPNIFTESGRYITAYNSILICNIIAREKMVTPLKYSYNKIRTTKNLTKCKEILQLFQWEKTINSQNYISCYHKVTDIIENLREAFVQGEITLFERALAENCLRRIYKKVVKFMKSGDIPPHEQSELDCFMSDIYFGNFSIFQSIPDAWVMGQPFPIMPIHRLNEFPSEKAVIADLTCDSDGIIKKYITYKILSKVLPLHSLSENENYYIGLFLVGAYQKILGNPHNLFGKVTQVYLDWNTDSELGFSLEKIIPSESPAKLLTDNHYNIEQLTQNFSELVKDEEFFHLYRESLAGKSYLNDIN